VNVQGDYDNELSLGGKN